METEPLLKLHRKFSTKEKLGLAQQRNNVLLSENAKLKKRVEELEKMILPKPYKKQDKEVISYQAYLRLKQKHDILYKHILELQDEMRELRKLNPKELL